MEELTNHYRERMVACLMVKQAQLQLAAYGPAAEAAGIEARIAEWMAMPVAERDAMLQQHVDGLQTAEEVVMLGDIHPQWIAQVIAQETPRVIGLLLRFLPSQHARHVIEQLPAELRQRLPNVIESFVVPDTVLRIVRQRFESHFIPTLPMSQVEQLNFAELHVLRFDELQAVLRDMGIDELALAFRRLAKPALRLLLNRLNFADAQALSQRIAAGSDDNEMIERDAQNALLGMSLDHVNPNTLIDEVALTALAKSIYPGQLHMMRLLKQKLPPRLAHVLQRVAETHVHSNHPEVVVRRQQRWMDAVVRLIDVGRIDQMWRAKLPEEVTPVNVNVAADEKLLVNEGAVS